MSGTRVDNVKVTKNWLKKYVKKEFVIKGHCIQLTISHEEVGIFCSSDPLLDKISIAQKVLPWFFLFLFSGQFKNLN